MTSIETGLWMLLVVVASVFTFLSLKTVDKASIAFNMLAMAMWMGLATIHAGGFGVAATSSTMTYNATGFLIFNETHADALIPEGGSASWLSFLFLGFAIFDMLLVFKQVVKL